MIVEIAHQDPAKVRAALLEKIFPGKPGTNGTLLEVDLQVVEVKTAILLNISESMLGAIGIDSKTVDPTHRVFGFAVVAKQLICAMQLPIDVVSGTVGTDNRIDWDKRNQAALELMRNTIINCRGQT